jgi:WD40 repeat protein
MRKSFSTSFWRRPDPLKTTPFLALLAAAVLSAAPQDQILMADAPVRDVFFLSDGKAIMARWEKHLRTWDVGSGKVISDRTVEPKVFPMDANLFIEIKDKGFQIWDLSADRHSKIINGTFDSAAVSRDHKQMAVGSEKDRTVRLLDLDTGAQRRELPDGLGGAASLAFSPDGATLVSANFDNDVRIWKTRTGELVRKIEDLTGAMFASSFTSNSEELVMGGLDETVYILDGKTFALKRTLKGQGETIAALAISPDGRTLVTGGFDVVTTANPVKLVFWDLASGSITRTARSPHAVSGLAFSPDGKWLAMTAVGGKEIALFSLNATTR